jgi:hypothetical protein
VVVLADCLERLTPLLVVADVVAGLVLDGRPRDSALVGRSEATFATVSVGSDGSASSMAPTGSVFNR